MDLSMQAMLLNVSNLDRSIEFYKDIFGLRPVARGEDWNHLDQMVYEVGD